ncbi:MAG TPA: signaling protein, partial [Nocardioides sp.]
MNQRTLAGIVAVPLVVALWAAAFFLPAPFVTYYPGTTADLISDADGASITVEGHEVYPPTDGELRMTTASITRPETKLTLAEALLAWRDPDATVRPYDTVYRPDEDNETSESESALQMTGSVDVSVAVALEALGIDVAEKVVVGAVRTDYPADGVLEPGDVVRAIGNEPVTLPEQ